MSYGVIGVILDGIRDLLGELEDNETIGKINDEINRLEYEVSRSLQDCEDQAETAFDNGYHQAGMDGHDQYKELAKELLFELEGRLMDGDDVGEWMRGELRKVVPR